MEKNPLIKDGTEIPPLQLPLGQLFYLLYSNGFSVKPDDYIEMLKITERFGSHDIDETARWICPIIATNETEQAKFYNIIEQYKKLAAANTAAETVKVKRIPRRLKIAVAAMVVALLLLMVWFNWPPKAYSIQEANRERFVEKGEPLLLDASALLQAPQDSNLLQFAWQFEDGSKTAGLKTVHVFTKPGDFFVKRQFASKKFALTPAADSLLVHVCNDLPKLQVKIPAGMVTVDQPVTITADVDAEDGTVSYYQWKIKDSVFVTKEPTARNIVFDKEGDYPVACKAVVGALNAPCTVTDTKTINVLDNGTHYNARFSAARPGSYSGKTALKWWVTLVLLLPAAAGLFYSLFRKKLKTTAAQEKKASAAAVNKGPHEIPFEQNDIKLIQQDRELRRTFIQMRYRSEEETLVLSVPGTINSIIRSGGSPQLVYAPLTQQQQYLVLIDRANPKSMLTRLFTWLVKSIADDGIPVTIFYYDKNFVSYNDNFPGGLTLQRLAETHSSATLIIMGKAYEMIYSIYAVIEEKIFRELNRWQSKAIITPLPVKDWSAKEKVLQQHFILLPADTSSLQQLIPALREKIKPNTSLLEITGNEQYSLQETDFREVKELRVYLNNDEHLFQWLCAICIYPRLRWEVLVELGKAILDKYGQPEKLNYANLLKLCRIAWMQQGVFPQATRLELLKNLTVENEICARERLLRMLNYSTSIYGEKGYFFEEEKRRQQLTNQFILHASNSEQYIQYAESRDAFKKIWKRDAILDMPLKKYLDKTGNDHWQTPVNNGQQSVGLTEYFSQHEVLLNKTIRLKKGLAAAMAVLLIGLWAWLGFGGGAAKLGQVIELNQDNKQQVISIAVTIIKNFSACADSANKRFSQLEGYLDFGNKIVPVPLTWNEKTATANFEVPYKNFSAGKANLWLSWDAGKSVKSQLLFGKTLIPDSVTITCIGNETKRPLYVRYNDTAGYGKIENALGNALYQFNLSALQSDFTDSSRIVYYEKNQLLLADSIAAMVQQALGLPVREEFISEDRTPSAVPILFLNTSPDTASTARGVKVSEAAFDYMGMAGQYYSEKQYEKAIEWYSKEIIANPNDGLAYNQRGGCYEALGTSYTEKALADYSAAIRINARDASSWYRRASIRYGLKKYADAIADYSKVISINSPDMKRQNALCVYFRGKSYYALKNQASACDDFKKSAALGVSAGKQDYTSYCAVSGDAPKPDCSKTFYSLKEALVVDAAVICRLDLSTESLIAIPRQLYSFRNLAQLNLGAASIPQKDIDQLQKALPNCKISFATQTAPAITPFGAIELDQNGYTNAAGQQVMEKVSRLLKAQPAGKVRLTAVYTNAQEQKMLEGYMNTIVNMFAKIGVNPKTQIEQQVSRGQEEAKQNAPAAGKMSIQVTGINIKDRTGAKAN